MNQYNEKNRKIVLITGAAKRLGKETAIKLHSLNMDIVVHCNNSTNDAYNLVAELNKKRQNSAISINFNLRDFSNYDQELSKLDKKWLNIDVLINNASTFYPTNIDVITTDDWDDLHDVNLKAPFFLSKFFYGSLKEKRGCIINIIDIHADRPLEDFPVYSMAKAGLKMLTKSLAIELAPFKIRVNAINPVAG